MVRLDRGPMFCHCYASTREHLDSLKIQMEQHREIWRSIRRESIKLLIATLQTLLDECELTSKDPLKAQWALPGLHLENVLIGDLEITLNLERFDVEVFNISEETAWRGGFQHPHVDGDGQLCWGRYSDQAKAYHQSGDFLALRDLINNLLHTYNSRSPYITLEEWANGVGEPCRECGEVYSPDELVYIERRDATYCLNCSAYCSECRQHVPYEDYDVEWDRCTGCVESQTSDCDECAERFMKDDLHSVKSKNSDGETDEIQLCPQCHKEFLKEQPKEEEEEDHEDSPDTESVLAPSMAVQSQSE